MIDALPEKTSYRSYAEGRNSAHCDVVARGLSLVIAVVQDSLILSIYHPEALGSDAPVSFSTQRPFQDWATD